MKLSNDNKTYFRLRQSIKSSLVLTIFASTLLCINVTAGEESPTVNNLIQRLRNDIEYKQQKQINLQQQLKSAEITIGNLSKQILHINQSLEQEQNKLNNLKSEQKKFFSKLKAQDAVLAKQIKTAYLLGQVQQWKIILNQEDPNAINRHFMYYRYLSQSRLKLITDFKQTLISLANNIESADKLQRNLKRLLASKQQQQTQQQQFLAIRQQLITQLNQQIKSKQQQIEMLLVNQNDLQETVSQLQAENSITTEQSFAKLRGQLHWPIQGEIIAHFGSPIELGNQHLTGVIIKAAPETPVHAISEGNVIFANWLRGFGLLVIISHGNNYMSLYARNQAIYANVGDHVNAGDVIAITGNSGGFNQSSLYFEIRRNGVPANPQLWCRN